MGGALVAYALASLGTGAYVVTELLRIITRT